MNEAIPIYSLDFGFSLILTLQRQSSPPPPTNKGERKVKKCIILYYCLPFLFFKLWMAHRFFCIQLSIHIIGWRWKCNELKWQWFTLLRFAAERYAFACEVS